MTLFVHKANKNGIINELAKIMKFCIVAAFFTNKILFNSKI
jgi:hypothetical protein